MRNNCVQKRIVLNLASILLIILFLPLSCTADKGETPSDQPKPATPTVVAKVILPEDDASHQVDTEWWYFNGHLFGDDQTRYSFHYVFFDIARDFLQQELLLGQIAVTDHQSLTYSLRMQPDKTQPSPQHGFSFNSMDWKMSGFNGDFELEGSVENHSFNLKLSASKPPVLHDLDGLIEFPIAGNSYYYTYPRLEVSGTLVDHGSLKTVTGTAWMDHQWGNFDPTLIDWDWYSVQLNDNTELMFFRVREPGGPIIHSLGTYIDADGESYALNMDDISVDHFDTWTSPSTKVTYHTGWLLNLPRFGISLRLDPTVQESEFYIPNINMPVYWEGPVEVSGTKDGFPIKGHGFVELTIHIESGKKLTSP